jgi:hypothetical protein
LGIRELEAPLNKVKTKNYVEADVSSYHLNRLLFDLKMSEERIKGALADLDRVMAAYDLTAEEKEALSARDPRKLRQLGAHGMLALYVMRLDPEFQSNIYWTQK